MYLEKIHSPQDLAPLDASALNALAEEMRLAIIDKVATQGGHLGSNLGIVEATIALHKVFSSPHDKLIFDVSHQTYAHKMLTGRSAAFVASEHFGDVSGFMSAPESEHDPFTIGHTSTSISLACGMALARDSAHKDYQVVAIIGDGALSGGEALEGLNFASTLKAPLVIVINDNNQSIAPNVGSLYAHLAELRRTQGKSEKNIFKLLNYEYEFVPDGHNIDALVSAFARAKDAKRPVVVHIVTTKGKGLPAAEAHQELFHSMKPFDVDKANACDYTPDAFGELFATCSLELAAERQDFFVITSATPLVLGCTPDVRERLGTSYIDVGIAEQSAVALAAGIAKSGASAVYGVQSTFLQRAYDQLAQEVALDSLPATVVVFGASIYATHDKTHQGRLDIPMLTNIPNIVYLAPATAEQFQSAYRWATEQNTYPVGIKMPGILVKTGAPFHKDWDKLNQYQLVQRGSRVALLGLGTFFSLAEEVAARLQEKGVLPTVINPLYASGIDTALLDELMADTQVFVTLEDGILEGGWGQKVAAYLAKHGKTCLTFGLSKAYRNRYVVSEELLRENLDATHIVACITDALE